MILITFLRWKNYGYFSFHLTNKQTKYSCSVVFGFRIRTKYTDPAKYLQYGSFLILNTNLNKENKAPKVLKKEATVVVWMEP